MSDEQAIANEVESTIHPLEGQRRENRSAIEGVGGKPYGERSDGLLTLAEARSLYDEAADLAHQESAAAIKEAKKANPEASEDELPALVDGRPRVRVAGRVMLKRGQGKLLWMQLRDHTTASARDVHGGAEDDQGEGDGGEEGAREASAFAAMLTVDLQIAVSKKDVAEPGFEIAKQADLGDVVVVEGALMKTKMGEITVWAEKVEMGTKSIAPPPGKWSGLQDVELRYRRRYIDLYSNPDAMQVFRLRSQIVQAIRDRLVTLGFLEVDTPTLQSQAGGAAARPFMTHMNALSIDLFMRIAPELYLKRLLVGGMPRVFEFSKNFRNEGVDKSHNPEFTSLEVYQAFGNYDSMADLAEGLIRAAALRVRDALRGENQSTSAVVDSELPSDLSLEPLGAGELVLPFGDLKIDYGVAFDHVTFAELFERALGFSMEDEARALGEAKKRGLKTTGEKGEALAPVLVVNELFEEVAEPTLDPARPTFVRDYPSALSPLTRPKADHPEIAERWDLFMGGMEIGPAYTELNDPDIQEAKFREQLAGIDDEESTFRNFDADFVNALKVGMPPAGGLGLGIDRLCMLLLNQRTIRDVILFPMMRPEV
ncbi:MAG: lysine--tRNA ligase [Planctomycetota bacterium]